MVTMPLRRLLVPTIASFAVLSPAPALARRTPPPSVRALRCVPIDAPRCANGPAVPVGLQVLLSGQRFYNGMRVTFRWSPTRAVATTLRRSHIGWVARVPARAHVGTVWVYVTDRRHRRSGARKLTVLEPRPVAPQTPVAIPSMPAPEPFRGGGMWIWYVSRSDGGDPYAIAERAKHTGMQTVFIKSADGPNQWSQLTSTLVATLHDLGLRVCGWQYVYGTYPVSEARAAAGAAAAGADCFVIDPEVEYEGRYASAQRYIDELRGLVGEDFPIGVASFPYVDYHPSQPYSVWLGPGGAQADMPQVYWRTIGGGVTTVSAHTFVHNRIYGRPITPLGQSYERPPASEIARFRSLWSAWGSTGMSWWSWQSTAAGTWPHLGGPLADDTPVTDPGWPALARRARGDQVIWLQQHLASVDATVTIDGVFGEQTDAALRALQTSRGLPETGVTDAATWAAILSLPVTPVDWTARACSASRAHAAGRRSRDEFHGWRPGR